MTNPDDGAIRIHRRPLTDALNHFADKLDEGTPPAHIALGLRAMADEMRTGTPTAADDANTDSEPAFLIMTDDTLTQAEVEHLAADTQITSRPDAPDLASALLAAYTGTQRVWQIAGEQHLPYEIRDPIAAASAGVAASIAKAEQHGLVYAARDINRKITAIHGTTPQPTTHEKDA